MFTLDWNRSKVGVIICGLYIIENVHVHILITWSKKRRTQNIEMITPILETILNVYLFVLNKNFIRWRQAELSISHSTKSKTWSKNPITSKILWVLVLFQRSIMNWVRIREKIIIRAIISLRALRIDKIINCAIWIMNIIPLIKKRGLWKHHIINRLTQSLSSFDRLLWKSRIWTRERCLITKKLVFYHNFIFNMKFLV